MAPIRSNETLSQKLMEEDYISISTLNDFIFCPYSIYLHNVYMESDEGLYHATPQTQGRIAHETVDEKKGSTSKDVIFALPVYSEKYRLMEKVDVYKTKEKCLIERKYQLKQIYQGQMFAEAFTGADSIMIIEGSAIKVMKYGNAIHRDQDVVFF